MERSKLPTAVKMFVPHIFLLLYNSTFSSSFSIHLKNLTILCAFCVLLKMELIVQSGRHKGAIFYLWSVNIGLKTVLG